jgi:outer membrane protein OmpA-like peptidoglycan-associated protein
MENDTQLDYKRLNDSHFMHGAGVEYGLGKGVLLRADLDLYDEDARLLSVGMRINLGGKEREPAPAPEPVVQPAPVPVAEPIPDPDSDGDGVLDRDDACPGTAVGTQVDSRGCEMERVIVLKGVTFALNSDELVGDSAAVLDEVATSLRRYPDQKVEVAGYTDSQGNDTYNRNLSQRRANSVRGYLIAQGVAAESLTAKGYGEANPIADNHTAEGRAQNRRVELRMMDNTLDAGPQDVSVAPVVAVVAAQKAVIDLCAGTTSGTEEAGTPCKLNEVTILDGVNFVIGSDQLVEGSQAVLDEAAATLKRYPGQRVEIGCHTDWKGSGSSNQVLSERRANTVREYLIGQGVTAELLSAKGYGEMQPIADNRTAEGREKNRRVELRLVK